jgi:uncharacterized protein (DUF433 family)
MGTERGQLSLRPTKHTLERLREHARITGQKHTVLAERYVAEGILMDEYPGIHFVDGALGRRPAVVGSGLDVWEIVEVLRDSDGSIEEAAAYLEKNPYFIAAAARYYGSNREEIDDWINRVHAPSEREQAHWLAAQAALAQ